MGSYPDLPSGTLCRWCAIRHIGFHCCRLGWWSLACGLHQRSLYNCLDSIRSANGILVQRISRRSIQSFCLVRLQRIAAGTHWTIRWLVDDQLFFEQTYPWLTVESGTDFLLSVGNPPEGNYELQLLVNKLQIVELEGTVGIGQLPIDRLAESEGTVLSGRVMDAATMRGVPSVTIVLISEDYSADEFEWKQEQVYALAMTDRNGDFQFARPLVTDTPYSVVIAADGYLPLAADGFSFSAEERAVDITIELVRG